MLLQTDFVRGDNVHMFICFVLRFTVRPHVSHWLFLTDVYDRH